MPSARSRKISSPTDNAEPAVIATRVGSPQVPEFAWATLIGLSDTPRWLPCRFVYDAHGSELFEKITLQPEYYLTRTEAAILERHATDIHAVTGPVTLIELGSGSSVKTDHLLRAYAATGDVVYVPIDVSDTAIQLATERISAEHEGVTVNGIVGTYEEAFRLVRDRSPSMVLFLGSTIGTFNQSESLTFWRKVWESLQGGDYFLLGVDLVKDVSIIEAAYNDAAGVTAEFTKNLFARMNRELGSDIDLSTIEHTSSFRTAWQRIETFTRFNEAQTIHIRPLDAAIEIAAGDQIMMEISRKFVVSDLIRFLSGFGFTVRQVYTDEREWFAEVLLEKRV